MSTKKFLIIILLFLGVIIHSNNYPVEDGYFFRNKEELKLWFNKNFDGGLYELKEYSKYGKTIFIANASVTCGVITSYIRVYKLTKKGLELIIIKEKVNGLVLVTEKEDKLIFYNLDVKEKILFILPWEGVF